MARLTHRRSARRSAAFTLMEVMLAAVLGSMVVLAAFGLFTALDREQTRQKIVVRETVELSRTQEATERSMQLLVMTTGQNPARPGTTASGTTAKAVPAGADGAPSPDSGKSSSAKSDTAPGGKPDDGTPSGSSSSTSGTGTGSGSGAGTTGTAGSAGAPGAPQDRPRLLLEVDRGQPAAMSWHGRLVAPQRLEVALLAAPAFPQPPIGMDRQAWQDRRRRSQSPPAPREDSAADKSATTTPAREWDIAPGVRGAFELTLEPAGKDQMVPSWTLAWRPIATATSAQVPVGPGQNSPTGDVTLADAGADDDVDLGRAVLATGLTACRWEVYINRKFVEDCSISRADDLPAYVRMSVATLTGNTMEWIFEVGWSTGSEPGSVVIASAAGGAAGAATTPAGTTNGTPTGTPTGTPAGTPAATPGGTPVVPPPGSTQPSRPGMPMPTPVAPPGTVKPITPKTKGGA